MQRRIPRPQEHSHEGSSCDDGSPEALSQDSPSSTTVAEKREALTEDLEESGA
jgi:hypothetical protein